MGRNYFLILLLSINSFIFTADQDDKTNNFINVTAQFEALKKLVGDLEKKVKETNGKGLPPSEFDKEEAQIALEQAKMRAVIAGTNAGMEVAYAQERLKELTESVESPVDTNENQTGRERKRQKRK